MGDRSPGNFNTEFSLRKDFGGQQPVSECKQQSMRLDDRGALGLCCARLLIAGVTNMSVPEYGNEAGHVGDQLLEPTTTAVPRL